MSVLVRSPTTTRVYFLEASRHVIGSSRGLPLSTIRRFADGFSYSACRVVLRTLPIVRTLNLLRQPVVIVFSGAGIFNLLSIAYAFQPQLRDRLTQGRRTLPWKPWVFGEGDFHPLYRLLMPCILTSMRSSTPCGIPSTHILRSSTAYFYSK